METRIPRRLEKEGRRRSLQKHSNTSSVQFSSRSLLNEEMPSRLSWKKPKKKRIFRLKAFILDTRASTPRLLLVQSIGAASSLISMETSQPKNASHHRRKNRPSFGPVRIGNRNGRARGVGRIEFRFVFFVVVV